VLQSLRADPRTRLHDRLAGLKGSNSQIAHIAVLADKPHQSPRVLGRRHLQSSLSFCSEKIREAVRRPARCRRPGQPRAIARGGRDGQMPRHFPTSYDAAILLQSFSLSAACVLESRTHITHALYQQKCLWGPTVYLHFNALRRFRIGHASASA
jgi:hypothetical protein